MTNEENNHSCYPAFLGGALVAIIGFTSAAVSYKGRLNEPEMPEAGRPSITQVYDVNRDGLEDVVYPTGTVQLRTRDGTLISLGEMRQKEIDAVYRKFEIRKEQVRNKWDNADYKVNTGRYIAGVSE